ncbi:MAG: polysaccharide biosynthesis C-terminal domain-containing protein [Muribaculaceae bacterium]|nr:polysaccharide biosynthesis C-terminal domain-containing protein [Muribaculaceae bacterium]MDE6027718.1 polysaccharide biosynthesis C-terminal domain-containing protein [Muribaculaceae bacterium]
MEKETLGLDYANGKISRLFFKIFLPTLLGMIFNALITIIDGIFVGRGVGPDGIAAVNIIAPLFMITTGIGLMFGIGASVVAGISLSQKDYSRANSEITSAFIFSTAMIGCIVLLTFIFTDRVAYILGSSEQLIYHTTGYLLYLLPGLVPFMWQSIGMMVIRLDGSPKYAMMCNIVPAVLNIILDWWFVFPLGIGVMGAALATAIAGITGGTMALLYFRRSYILKFTRHISRFWRSVGMQARIGAAAFVTEIAMSVMMFTGNYVFMKTFGESGVAAYSIACYLFPLIFMMNNAVAQSAQPIISYNYGSGDRGRVRGALMISLKVAIACGMIATVGIASGARLIVGMFISPECEAGRIAVKGLPIFSLAALFFALNIAFIGYWQSIKKAALALGLTLLRGMVLLVPLFLVLTHIFPAWGMWAAVPASEMLTLMVIASIYLAGHKTGRMKG